MSRLPSEFPQSPLRPVWEPEYGQPATPGTRHRITRRPVLCVFFRSSQWVSHRPIPGPTRSRWVMDTPYVTCKGIYIIRLPEMGVLVVCCRSCPISFFRFSCRFAVANEAERSSRTPSHPFRPRGRTRPTASKTRGDKSSPRSTTKLGQPKGRKIRGWE